jgi:N-acetylneuraminate lyase
MHNRGFWISGIVPAVFTPMNQDGSINFHQINPIVNYLLKQKADALYICGSTGEGPSLTTEERFAVVEAYIEAVDHRVPIIVQVGHDSIKEAKSLAEHAQKCGADAISSIPPTYFKIHTLDILIECLEEITSGAPDLPFYYYHIPRLTSLQVDMIEFIRKGSSKLPTMQGIKYSDFKIFEFQACLEFDGGRFNMLFGSDEMFLSGLVVGAHGAVGSTYNFATPLFKKIIHAYQQGDLKQAKELQSLVIKMVQRINKYCINGSNGAPLKAMMAFIGLDCGPIRLPQLDLTDEMRQQLQQDMVEIEFFEWGPSF